MYGARAIKSVHVIVRKAIMKVEAAGLWKWALMQNNKCSLPGNRMVAEFNGDCNFEGTSTVSNYGTASESDE